MSYRQIGDLQSAAADWMRELEASMFAGVSSVGPGVYVARMEGVDIEADARAFVDSLGHEDARDVAYFAALQRFREVYDFAVSGAESALEAEAEDARGRW